MHSIGSGYGLWSLVVIDSAIFLFVAFSFWRPKTKRDWRAFGGFWTLQQMREAIPSDHSYRFVIHDRDAIFSTEFDASVANLGLAVIRTPVRSPKANALCERLIGTLRRECLDWIIPSTEAYLRKTLSWLAHYNRGRPHSSLGPRIPDPPPNLPIPMQRQRHRCDRPGRIVARAVLNGLHHEYSLCACAA
jgi:putative transposase